MKRVFLKIVTACLLVSACGKNNDHANTPQAKLQGPIQPPTSGYGADGSHQVGETSFENPQYSGTKVTIFYPFDMNAPRPTIFYSHPYGGEDKEYNRGLFEFIAQKGYVLVFVPYPTSGVTVEDRYNTLWAGFTKAVADFANLIDTRKVGFMGHSFGGGASIALSYKAFKEEGWGQDGRFLFTMAPWYSYQISPQQLQSFPSNVKFITQVYDEDDTNDHRMAIDIFKHINISSSEKDFIYFKSSTVAGYTYRTDHVLPNSRSAFDALDYYGVYRLLDALIDYSFNNKQDAKSVALGNGSPEQITMPAFKGQLMAPLIVTDNPSPQYPQRRYLFPCGSPENPRIGNCD